MSSTDLDDADTAPDSSSFVVYVVCAGEDHEGSDVKGIFSSRDAARAYVPYLIARMSLPWRMIEKSPDYWHGGCDYIRIKEHTVYARALPRVEAVEAARRQRMDAMAAKRQRRQIEAAESE